jgi:radical SAM superfamily enzyme YgiQ (UPF0313 family)
MSKLFSDLKKVKISFLNIDLRVPVQRLPINWLNFKNYYTKNSKFSSQVQWNEPILNFENVVFDDIITYYDNQDADVYAFSSYLWSHMAVVAVAKELKRRNSNRIIVFGGPHLNITHNNLEWFIKNKFVDAVCEPTSYGEWFMTDLLDQLVENNTINWKDVRFAIHKYGRGPTPSKIDFEFPGPIIPGNEDVLFKCKDIALDLNIPLVLPIELTRGCPYECVFCEWGGGIGSKVVRKSMQDIKTDLDYIPQAGIEQVQILDANYGIYKEDTEVSLYIEELNNTFGIPKHVEIYGMTKSKQERRWETIEPLARCGAIERYKLSLQTLDDKVLQNIKRTDVPRDEDFKFAKYLFDQYGVRSDFEFIMGLPGHTLQRFYDEVDIQYEYGYGLERYIWLFLPDSPAYASDYVTEHNIKTVKTCIGKSRMNSYAFDDVTNFSNYHISADPNYISDVEFVVEANGYTREDYTEFFFMNYWILENVEMFDVVQDIIKHNLSTGKLLKPSIIFKEIYNQIMQGNNAYTAAIKNLRDQMYDFILGNRKDVVDFKMYDLPNTNTSIDFTYIYKTCIVVFNSEYLQFLEDTTASLGLEIPTNIVDNFHGKVDEWKKSSSPKYDKLYQVRTYYEEFLRNQNA